jgi:hypothetical protein
MPVASDSIYEPYKIRIIRESASSLNVSIIWNDENKATFLTNFWRAGVWSHLIMDNFFPMFRLMKIFGLNADEYVFEPLASKDMCEAPHGCPIQGNLFSDEWISLFTKNSSTWTRTPNSVGALTLMKKYEKETNGIGLLCFSNFFVGLSVLTDHGTDVSNHGRDHRPEWPLWGIGDVLWEFRSHVFKLAKVSSTAPIIRDLIVLKKGTKSHITIGDNGASAYEALLERLFALYPHLADRTKLVTMENFPIKDQIEHMASSKVAFSITGSTSFPSMWLPKGGTVVLMMREKDQRLDASLYGNLGYVDSYYYNMEDIGGMIAAIVSGIERFDNDRFL